MGQLATASRPSVLIVEDERIVAKDLQQTLLALGYDAFAIASSAEEALARASERIPDLVLMDIRIKGELDGIQTAELFRARYGTPLVYLTAHSDDAIIERAKVTEPIGYLIKPIKTAELRSVIEVSLYRHHLERRHRERERWFVTTLRSIADAVVATDTVGGVTFMNPVAEKLTGWRASEAEGRPIDEVVTLVPGGSSRRESPVIQSLRDERVIDGGRAKLHSRTNGARVVHHSAAPIVDDGRLIGAVMVFRDVTERDALESQVELSNRLASLGAMAAGVAHEVNNPLTVVNASLDIARRELLAAASGAVEDGMIRRLEELVADATLATQRIQSIVRDLRVFMRKPGAEVGVGDVQEAVLQALHATTHETRGRVRVETGTLEVPPVALPEARLVQVLVNLVVNAVHAFDDEPGWDAVIEVDARQRGSDIVELTVSDNGPGMSAEVADRVFEPFFTTKPLGKGTGLGLFLCHGIVTGAGGVLTVESELGVGTTFRIRLPIAR